jgi:ATP-dependent helicase/DNAse subunit B
MSPDKYAAVWVSHSSIGDYRRCPRAYYLNNVYKDPRSGHKITLMQPALALGQAVHEVIESLSELPVAKRLEQPLTQRLEQVWVKVAGKLGGFRNQAEETDYQERGRQMLRQVEAHPGPITQKAVKIPQELPFFWLSEDENIILCGKIDWLEYLPEDNSIHIIDFKTGKREESADSLQLPIYHLLVTNCQKRPVTKASYWYLDLHDKPKAVDLPDLTQARDQVLTLAKKMKLARTLNHFRCPHNGCRYCEPLEKIVKGEAELVGVNDFNQDIYILP